MPILQFCVTDLVVIADDEQMTKKFGLVYIGSVDNAGHYVFTGTKPYIQVLCLTYRHYALYTGTMPHIQVLCLCYQYTGTMPPN